MLIAEELLLLSTDDAKGTDSVGALQLGPSLRAALLAELGLAGKITMTGAAESATASTTDAGPTGDPILDAELAEVRKHDGGKLSALLGVKFSAGLKDKLRRDLLERLVAAGVLTKQDRRVLGLFGSTKYPEADPEPERQIRDRLRRVLVDGDEPDDRTAVLIALLHSLQQIGTVLPGADRAVAQRAERIANGEALPQALQASQSVIVTVIAANAAITAVNTSIQP